MHIMNVTPNTTYSNTHSIIFTFNMQTVIHNPLVASLLGGDIKSKVDDRNKTQLNRHWKRFAQHPLPEGLGRGESVEQEMRFNAIPSQHMNDPDISGFMAFRDNDVKPLPKIKPALRATKSFISWNIQYHGIAKDLEDGFSVFPIANQVWKNIRKNPKFKNHDGEQAPITTEEDEIKLLDIQFWDDQDRLRRDLLQAKCYHDVGTSTMMRLGELKNLKQKHVDIDRENLTAWILSEGAKTRDGRATHGVKCTCPHRDHDWDNIACPFNRMRYFDSRKSGDRRYFISTARTIKQKENAEIPEGELPYWRRERFNSMKNKSVWETRYSLQGKSKEKLAGLMNLLSRELGLSTDKFRGHSTKRIGVCEMERNFGDKLDSESKLILSNHANMKMYHHYANRREFAQKRAISKRADLMRDVQARRLKALSARKASKTTTYIPPMNPSNVLPPFPPMPKFPMLPLPSLPMPLPSLPDVEGYSTTKSNSTDTIPPALTSSNSNPFDHHSSQTKMSPIQLVGVKRKYPGHTAGLDLTEDDSKRRKL